MKRKSRQESQNIATTPEEQQVSEPKKKKKKSRDNAEDDGIGVSQNAKPNVTEQQSVPSLKQKKKKKSQSTAAADERVDSNSSPPEPGPSMANEEEEPVAKKKRKPRTVKGDDPKEKKPPQLKKKKKRKKGKKVEVQAKDVKYVQQRGIEYLEQWKNDRDAWKFHKLRQIWLVDNMLDADMLPDDLFPTFLEYAAGDRGRLSQVILDKTRAVLRAMEEQDKLDTLMYKRSRRIIQSLNEELESGAGH